MLPFPVTYMPVILKLITYMALMSWELFRTRLAFISWARQSSASVSFLVSRSIESLSSTTSIIYNKQYHIIKKFKLDYLADKLCMWVVVARLGKQSFNQSWEFFGLRLIDIAAAYCFCQETFSFLSADLNIRPMGSIGQPRLSNLQRRLLGFKGSPAHSSQLDNRNIAQQCATPARERPLG